ncbi:MAG: DUF2063 domain-containing protein [Xanthomonadales bacterium]|nr:DUF2063 domain-containing protein [Xanthomonadales bacterium]
MSSKTVNKPDKLISLQTRFAAHIRSPGQVPAPTDVEDRRMDIYRNLFFNNVRSLLAWNFPVLRKLHSEEDWAQMVRDFYVEHRARTPLFPELPREFLQYIQEKRQNHDGDPPFLLELAHYEWVEGALGMEEAEIDDTPADPDGDLLAGIPVLSALAWPLSYRFPVHRIGPKFQPKEPPEQATHLLVYRNRADEVKFMRLNAVSALLLQSLKEEKGLAGLEILNDIVTQLDHPKPEVVIEGGRKLLVDLRHRDVILGTQP